MHTELYRYSPETGTAPALLMRKYISIALFPSLFLKEILLKKTVDESIVKWCLVPALAPQGLVGSAWEASCHALELACWINDL